MLNKMCILILHSLELSVLRIALGHGSVVGDVVPVEKLALTYHIKIFFYVYAIFIFLRVT